MNPLIRVLAVSFLIILSACARTAPPAPYIKYGTATPEGAGVMSARKGDNVYTIARMYSLPVRDIIDANDLSPPYALQTGQRLVIPAPREYTVQAGDTIYRLSRVFSLSQKSLVQMNGLKPPYRLQLGQILRLPHAAEATQVAVESSAPLVGQPPTDGRAAMPQAVTSENLPPPSSTKTATATTSKPLAPTPAVGASQGFKWPVQGRVISGFGPKKDGLHNDGINIAAPRGTAERAAGDGSVAYVGDDLHSFGNLVLVRHDGGWVTAYGHLNKTLIKRGDVIKQGQALGTVGTTGTVDSPQLHFEIRKGAQAFDPQKKLKS